MVELAVGSLEGDSDVGRFVVLREGPVAGSGDGRAVVGDVGTVVGSCVDGADGTGTGCSVVPRDGSCVGCPVGSSVGRSVGRSVEGGNVGIGVGWSLGAGVTRDGSSLGLGVGDAVASLQYVARSHSTSVSPWVLSMQIALAQPPQRLFVSSP